MLEAEKVRGGGGRTVKKQLANGLTVGRMVCAALLLDTLPFSVAFYVLYTLCGVTDLLDGPVARRTGSARFDPDEKGVCFARTPHEDEN